jgi:hypothetical protein
MNRHILHLALFGLAAFGTSSAQAVTETEPNNTDVSANVIALGTNGNTVPVTGALGNTNGNGSGGKDNSDFSKVTNSAGYSTIGISLQFSGSLGGGDSASLRINGPGVSEIISVSGQGAASFTINPAGNGSTYVVEIRTQFNDGEKTYTLTYDPSPDMGLVGQINAKQAEIVAKQQEIAKIQNWIAANDAAIASTSAKVKKAKTKTKKKKFVKTLKTIQSWKQQNTLSLVVAQSELTILQNDLANLQSML